MHRLVLSAVPRLVRELHDLLARETIVPTMGARTRPQLTEALAALDVSLTPAEVTALEKAVPEDAIAGERYPAPLMATLDSER